MRADGVLDREGVQPELLGHDLQISGSGIIQVQPRHGVLVVGEPVTDLLGREALLDKHPPAVQASPGRALRRSCG